MLIINLAISCLTASNLPWFMDLTFQVPMHHCSLQHQILLSTLHIHNWESFPLWPSCFVLSGAISSCPLYFPGSICIGHLPAWGLIFQCHISLPFYTAHGVLMASIWGWFVIPSSSGLCFVRTLHFDLSILGDPAWHGSW